MKRILITGATGFVGSHALEALHGEADLRIIAACRDPNRLPAEYARMECKVGDLRDADFRKQIVKESDILVHTAAWTSLYGHHETSRSHYLEPTLELIDEARQSGIERFIFISTNSASAPDNARDDDTPGIPRSFWPHLCNVIHIENRLREIADDFDSVVNLRLGLFVGKRYNLGLLPILLPRLRTHLVPWVAGGRTDMPLVDGRDIGQAIKCAVTTKAVNGFESFNVAGPETPSVRQVIDYLHQRHGYPKPHFGVPFRIAYPFAWLMEKIDPLVPWEPLVTRSIIHLLEETDTDNGKAAAVLGYRPEHHWKASIDAQIEEMTTRQHSPMSMHVKIS